MLDATFDHQALKFSDSHRRRGSPFVACRTLTNGGLWTRIVNPLLDDEEILTCVRPFPAPLRCVTEREQDLPDEEFQVVAVGRQFRKVEHAVTTIAPQLAGLEADGRHQARAAVERTRPVARS
jgi:hypothetical protein